MWRRDTKVPREPEELGDWESVREGRGVLERKVNEVSIQIQGQGVGHLKAGEEKENRACNRNVSGK